MMMVDLDTSICFNTLYSGAYFGELSMLTGQPRIASALAAVDSVLFYMTAADFRAAASQYPEYNRLILTKAHERLQRVSSKNASAAACAKKVASLQRVHSASSAGAGSGRRSATSFSSTFGRAVSFKLGGSRTPRPSGAAPSSGRQSASERARSTSTSTRLSDCQSGGCPPARPSLGAASTPGLPTWSSDASLLSSANGSVRSTSSAACALGSAFGGGEGAWRAQISSEVQSISDRLDGLVSTVEHIVFHLSETKGREPEPAPSPPQQPADAPHAPPDAPPSHVPPGPPAAAPAPDATPPPPMFDSSTPRAVSACI